MNHPNYRCGCTDKWHKPKRLYHDQWSANEQAEIAKQDRQALVEVYKCPAGLGFHLTSNVQGRVT